MDAGMVPSRPIEMFAHAATVHPKWFWKSSKQVGQTPQVGDPCYPSLLLREDEDLLDEVGRHPQTHGDQGLHDRADGIQTSRPLASHEETECSHDADALSRGDTASLEVIAEKQFRLDLEAETNGRGLARAEHFGEAFGERRRRGRPDVDPRGGGGRRSASWPLRACAHDFIPDLPRHHDAAKQVTEQFEASHATEVDEGTGVGNYDHRDSSVATSFLRSSAE